MQFLVGSGLTQEFGGLDLPGWTAEHRSSYQDLCPWNLCICTRTYVLGIYIYLPGLMSLEFMYVYTRTYVLGMYVIILTRTYVLGIYVYISGLLSLEFL